MKIHNKLILLHSALALFALVTATATIYGVQLHIRSANRIFYDVVNESTQVQRLRVDARSELVYLYEIVNGRREANAAYRAHSDAFYARLAEFGDFASAARTRRAWQSLEAVRDQLQGSYQHVLSLVETGDFEAARDVLDNRIEFDLQAALDARLDSIHLALEEERRSSIDRVSSSNIALLAIVCIIGVACLAIIICSSVLVDRWLLTPMRILREGTREFASGNLGYRMSDGEDNEFGSLGRALNTMASSLESSQARYRSLFENLRDAVIICDPDGRVVECRDSDTKLLDVYPSHAIGRDLLSVWPHWEATTWDWPNLLARVSVAREYVRFAGMLLPGKGDKRHVVDLTAYPVQDGATQHAVIILRDVTERHRLLRLERRAETMTATETFARGIAHDFKNLLTIIAGTLDLIRADPHDERNSKRATTAMDACRQAASLSNRLVRLSCCSEGQPESLCVGEIVDIVLSSLEEPLLEHIQVETQTDHTVNVHMDRDHLTQVILNLTYNACEAMPDGGKLIVTLSTTMTTNPLGNDPPSRHARLSIIDSGCGMSAEIVERVFEPLFTTKPRGPGGVRGLGLASVYAAVRHAGGFIQIDSRVGRGTTIQVCLPVDHSTANAPPTERSAQRQETT